MNRYHDQKKKRKFQFLILTLKDWLQSTIFNEVKIIRYTLLRMKIEEEDKKITISPYRIRHRHKNWKKERTTASSTDKAPIQINCNQVKTAGKERVKNRMKIERISTKTTNKRNSKKFKEKKNHYFLDRRKSKIKSALP